MHFMVVSCEKFLCQMASSGMHQEHQMLVTSARWGHLALEWMSYAYIPYINTSSTLLCLHEIYLMSSTNLTCHWELNISHKMVRVQYTGSCKYFQTPHPLPLPAGFSRTPTNVFLENIHEIMLINCVSSDFTAWTHYKNKQDTCVNSRFPLHIFCNANIIDIHRRSIGLTYDNQMVNGRSGGLFPLFRLIPLPKP